MLSELDLKIRSQFPLLSNRDMVYLDNAATSQKPQCVIDAVNEFYQKNNANPGRGLYELSIDCTNQYEEARQTVADFINAKEKETIIFTRNASESLNLIAYSYGMHNLKEGDEIIVNIAEHHSNILPWRNVARHTGAVIKYYDIEQDGEVKVEKLAEMITDKTKIITLAQISNVFGRLNDIKAITRIAHEKGIVVVCDGAQSVPHIPVDVQDLDVDFLAFSGHKMFAPMGIGVLFGKRELLEAMPPFLYGGEMIEYVTREGETYAPIPEKFEAGTVNAAGAIGLAAAIRYIQSYGMEFIEEREYQLTKYAMEKMSEIPNVHLIGSDKPEEHHGILTFKIDGVHPHDIAAIFDSEKIGVRAGHHCAQPLHLHIGIMSTTRASLAFYNTKEDIDAFIACLGKIRGLMGYGE